MGVPNTFYYLLWIYLIRLTARLAITQYFINIDQIFQQEHLSFATVMPANAYMDVSRSMQEHIAEVGISHGFINKKRYQTVRSSLLV